MSEIRWEGLTGREIASRLGVPRTSLHTSVGSTLDVAHELAADGASAGTLVLAETQTAGRGRHRRNWISPAGTGIWLTLIERPPSGEELELLSLRAGIAVAEALDDLASEPIQVKWPNDLYVRERKLAGILVETRWRESQPEWVAIGFGLNVRPPGELAGAAGLREGADRLAVLERLVPALRSAASATGALRSDELRRFAARDYARGRRCSQPVVGVVQGIDAEGALRVTTAAGATTWRAGSLVLEEDM